MAKPMFIYIINPHIFQWVTHSYEDGSYVIEAYATNEKANLVATKPFLEFHGNEKDTSNPERYLLSQVDLFESNYSYNSSKLHVFYGELQHIDDRFIIKEAPYTPSSPSHNLVSDGVNALYDASQEKICIFAKKVGGYIQPISKSWMYDILKGSLVSLKTDSVFPSSIVYMILKTWRDLPEIHTVSCSEIQVIDKQGRTSLRKDVMTERYVIRFLEGCKVWDTYIEDSPICDLYAFSTNTTLRNRIIKRKSIFPISRKVIE